jgi:hypothetical protein
MERDYFKLRRYHILAVTLLALLIPFCGAYLYYVTSQKTYFTNQNFRLLAVMSNQIKSKIENLSSSLWHVSNPDSKQVWIWNQAARKKDNQETLEDVKKLFRIAEITSADVTINADIIKSQSGSPQHFEAGQDVKRSRLKFDFVVQPNDRGDRVKIHAETNLNELIGPFVSQDGFDEVLGTPSGFDEIFVANQECGAVVFQRTPSQLSLLTLTSLLDKGGKKIEFNSSGLHDVQLAGIDYKLFVHPFQVFLSERTVSNDDPPIIKWALCGLMRADHFRSGSLAISYTIILVFIFLVLMVALGWPILKLRFMGPKDRLRAADVYFLSVSTLMGSAVLTFFLLDLYAYTTLQEQMDDQLKMFAEKINNNLKKEIGLALDELDRLNRNPKLREQSEYLLREQSKYLASNRNKTDSHRYIGQTNILEDLIDYRSDLYPYLDMVVWIDHEGQQRIKWTIEDHTTPFIQVGTRSYVRNVKEGRLLKDKSGLHDFWLESIYSWNTGENLAVISTRMPPPNSTWVGAISTCLPSLIQTVLPVGFGYCVIENDGRVLFHVNKKRNLRENFLILSEFVVSAKVKKISRMIPSAMPYCFVMKSGMEVAQWNHPQLVYDKPVSVCPLIVKPTIRTVWST